MHNHLKSTTCHYDIDQPKIDSFILSECQKLDGGRDRDSFKIEILQVKVIFDHNKSLDSTITLFLFKFSLHYVNYTKLKIVMMLSMTSK